MKRIFPSVQTNHRLSIFLMLVLLFALTGLKAQTIFWSDNFDAPAGGVTNNNDGVGWSGSTATPGGGSNGSILGITDVWVIGSTTNPATICTGTGNKLYVEAMGSGSANRYESDIYTDKLDATPNISTVGVTGITLVFDWRCNGVSGSDYGLVGLSSNGGTSWTWLPTQYQGESNCQPHDSIHLSATYEGISDFKIAYRFISSATSCSTCDPPFNIDNIQLIGTVAGSNCSATITSQNSTNPTCNNANNGTITLAGSDTTTGVTLTYIINSGTPDSNHTGLFTGLAPGTYTVSLSDSNCTTTGTSIVITNPAAVPAPTASNTGPYCAGATLQLNATTVTGATYAWTGPNNFSGQTPSKTNITTADSGTYTVIATVGGCNSAPATTHVVINNVPATPTAANNGPVCTGDTLKLTATTITGATYTWTGPNNFSTQNPVVPNATDADSGIYTVVAALGGCSSAPATTRVIINATPATPNASNNGPLCAGDTLKLTASTVTGATYTWTGPNNFSTQNPVLPNATTTDAGNYTVIAMVGSCPSTAASTTVVINSTPASPVATNNGPVCAGSTLHLYATTVTGASYTWTGPNNFNVQDPTINGASVADSGTYTVIATVGGCNSAPATTTASVKATPATPVASNTGPACAGANVQLNATTISGATYSWTGPNNFSVQNPPINSVSIADSGTYTVIATVNGCSSAGASTNLIVIGALSAPVVSNNGPLCSGSTLNLTATSVTGASYSWTGPVNFSTQDPSVPNVPVGDSGTYTVIASISGCNSPSSSTHVVITQSPAAPTVDNNGPICAGSTLNLTATTVSGATYSWTGPNNFSTQDPSITNATVADSGTYTVIVTVGLCSSTPVTTLAIVNPTPATPTATNTGPYCAGGTLQLNASSTAGASYTWSGPNNFIVQNPSLSNITLADSGTYTVIATIGLCSSSSATTKVVVKPLPNAPTLGSNSAVCAGDTLNLTASTISGATYAWSGPNNFNQQNPSITNVSSSDSGTYTVIVTVGLCSSAPVTITAVVKPAPPSPTASNSGPACIGATIQLNATTVSGASYTWTGPNNFIVQNPSISNATNADAGTYTVVATVGTCNSLPSTTTVAVNSPPTAPTITTADSVVCSNDSATICAQGTFAGYLWSNSDTTACFSTTDVGPYTLTVTDANGCTAKSANTINISNYSPSPVTLNVNGDTLSSPGAFGYQWYLNGQAIPGDTTSTIVATQSGNYSVEITNIHGCQSSSTETYVNVSGIGNVIAGNGIKVYPNPLQDGNWQVDIAENLTGSACEIFDANGRLVYKGKLRSVHSEISLNAAAGIYMMQIRTEQTSYNVKLVKLY